MSLPEEVLVVRTGIANTASVLSALARIGTKGRLSELPEDVCGSDYVMLPGVGAFGAGMKCLRENGLARVVCERVSAGRPTLAVCLGMQLFLEASEETPGVAGLGIIRGEAKRFSSRVRCPQLGWNKVEASEGCRILSSGFAYFANSFRLEEAPQEWNAAYSDYDGSFAAALEQGSVLVTQFHPELSGAWGLSVIKRWLER